MYSANGGGAVRTYRSEEEEEALRGGVIMKRLSRLGSEVLRSLVSMF